LLESLQIAARNSREYQSAKEEVFLSALRLDLEQNEFRTIWSGIANSIFSSDRAEDETVSGVENMALLGLDKKFEMGARFAFNLGVDLVKLLTQDKASALGSLADATLSIPLLRGSGRFVVTEPLTQAERDVVYAVYTFERFKRTFAVLVASDYLDVLQQLDQVENARENYKRLVLSTRRARRLSEVGRLPEIQVDQVRQDELRARNRWILARIAYRNQLDRFKIQLGLPTDSSMELDELELEALVERAQPLIDSAREQVMPTSEENLAADDPVELKEPAAGGGRMELDEEEAIRISLENRLDLRTRMGRIQDAQRSVAVAADQLRADLALLGQARIGESRSLSGAADGDGKLDFDHGSYSAGLDLDLPLERTAERNLYRESLIGFERSVRSFQELEDRLKLDVREELRTLMGSRETVAIQATAVEVALRRVESTSMFLEAGRAEIRDVLEAEESLVSAQNALSAALVAYRVGELELQRDMGVLEVDEEGLWKEYIPLEAEAETP
jgi:outer membrane protein TolC